MLVLIPYKHKNGGDEGELMPDLARIGPDRQPYTIGPRRLN